MIDKALFSSKSDEWSTPQDFYDKLNEKYNFVYDLAATEENTKCPDFSSIESESLENSWHMINGWCWLNPPYSKCKEFVKKSYEEMELGAKIVMLIPSRTDTKWFHEYIYEKEGVKIEFIKGRLKFGTSKNSAPFPSMLVIFNNNDI